MSDAAEPRVAMIGRRAALATLPAAAAAVAWGGALCAATPAPRVAVVGAGVVGVSIAYHLARSGAQVVVIDKGAPGMGCTQGAFAMLIVGHPDGPEAFNALYGLAVADWRRLQAELGDRLPVQWGGTINWAAPGEKAAKLRAECDRLAGWGVAAQAIDAADLARLSPGVAAGPFGAGSFLPEQGAVDVMGGLTVLLAACQRMGVRFITCEVTGMPIDAAGHAALQTSEGPIAADRIVLAAGAGTTAMAAMAGVQVPIDIVSGTLAHSRPMPPILKRVLNGPHGSVKQNLDGRIVTGLDYAPGADGKDVSPAYGRHLLATAAEMVPALRGAELEFMTVGHVPIPSHGQQPIVGFCALPANLYVATMMSGVTMAPLMGRLVAGEVLGRGAASLLAPWRPGRFNPQWAAL